MFVEKLNKKQDGVYVIEEEKTIANGIWEGYLDHDNVNHETIYIYTGPKLTGEKVENYFISTPSEMPWKTHLKVFSNSEKIYITYESQGDQVEAEDINLLQDSLVEEIDRAISEENRIDKKLDDEIVRAITEDEKLSEEVEELKEKKADKVYVDTELNKKYNKDEVFNKQEVLQKIQDLIGAAPEALDTLEELARALDNDPNFATNIINLLSTKVDKVAGKGLSTEDYTTEEKQKLAGIEEGANKYTHPSTHSANMIVETSSKRFVSDAEKAEWNNAVEHIEDNIRHITEEERDKWNTVENKVDKVAGKGLSTNDYTDEEKQKNQDNADNISDLQQELEMHKAEKATQEQLGHVKAGNNITIDADGTINAKGGNVDSVNGKTGEVVIDVPDIEGLVSSKLVLGRNASGVDYSVALGRDASAGNSAVALGDSVSAGVNSVALGRDASAGGTSAVALGRNASAGHYTVALGNAASAENINEGILGGVGSYSISKWIVPGSFTVEGTKNFEIPHPKPEKKSTHRIRHGAVESPTAGDTLYRWKIQATKDNDIVTIDLPDYFIWLNKDVQVFVTPQGHFGNGYGILNRETEQLEIHCQFAGEYNVLVIGTRNDDHQSVQDWYIKGVEREIGESWTGETYAFSVDEIIEIEEIKEVSA